MVLPQKSTITGFTLIELLITLSIIAILSAVALVSYQNVLRSGRDAKRQSDLKVIQVSLQEYHSDQFYYPPLSEINFGSALKNPDSISPSKIYLNLIPSEPLAGSRYVYEVPAGCDSSNTSKCTTYCLYANLENKSAAQKASNCTNPAYNFAVSAP